MRTETFRTIQQVLTRTDEGERADEALQQVLRKAQDLAPEEKREISELVYAYFRWFGWLQKEGSLTSRLNKTVELDTRFASNPGAFSDDELLEKALPSWLWECTERDHRLVRALQAKPKLWLRARPGKAADLASRIEGGATHPAAPDAIEYSGDEDLYKLPEFHAGEFEIQDLSSQLVGLICAPRPGSTWWDACAGEGGKTLHLCDQMQNKGLVWASDKAEWRLKILAKRAARARLFNYRTKVWVNTDKPAVKGPFDGVLVDGPCSGVGTWGRNSQSRWTTTAKDVEELAALQLRILNATAGTLKPGAKLIYSVCTLTRDETVGVVEKFAAAHPHLNPTRREILHPADHGGIGMFVQVFERTG